MHNISELLDSCVQLARQAGAEILRVYRSGDFDVSLKGDDSPLTRADLKSHDCLSQGLTALEPGLPLISEESGSLPFAERQRWQRYWLIDPLDGTKEFIKRNGEFTVNIALIEDHQPILGVVYVPVTAQCYFAARGVGAFKQVDAQAAEAIAVRSSVSEMPVVVGSRSHGGADLAAYLTRLGRHELIAIGSSLKFCLVAEGEADLYPRIGPTSEWDTAAAQCVVEQAGGRVTDFSGQALRYNTKESYLNPHFLVYGDRSRQWIV